MLERNWFSIIYIGILGGLAGFLGSTAYGVRSNFIPRTDKVQSGYVVPNKLEIKLEDLDGNEQKETILKYGGKKYLLTLDKQGNPRVQAYEVKPAEVVPKE